MEKEILSFLLLFIEIFFEIFELLKNRRLMIFFCIDVGSQCQFFHSQVQKIPLFHHKNAVFLRHVAQFLG